MSKRKKLVILITTIAVAVFCMVTTLAWQKMINKVNALIGNNIRVTLRDDFDQNTGLKDVYVENNGSVKIFVRIKLDEAMNLKSNKWLPEKDSDWKTHEYPIWQYTQPAKIPLEDCGKTNAEGEYFHHYFKWEMGGGKYYRHSDGSQLIYQDITQYNVADPNVRKTPYAEIISITEYLNMVPERQDNFVGWICDKDGYAYWSRPLEPNMATGLLLHKININSSIAGAEYYYAINVILEAVNLDDIPMWTKGVESVDGSGKKYAEATENGKKVINKIANLMEIADWAKDLTGTRSDIGKEFYVDGNWWLVIDVDTNGNLLITSTLWFESPFNNNTQKYYTGNILGFGNSKFGDTNIYAGSTLETAMKNIYDNKLNILKAMAQPVDLTNELSKVSITGERTCFALSKEESLIFVDVMGMAKYSMLDDAVRSFWLRTPLNGTANRVYITDSYWLGVIEANIDYSYVYINPALWIKIPGLIPNTNDQYLLFEASEGKFYVGIGDKKELYTGQSDKWSWNNATKTLTLNGFKWETTAFEALYINGDITLEVKGNNTFKSFGFSETPPIKAPDAPDFMPILVPGAWAISTRNLTITGDGTLNVIADYDGFADNIGIAAFGDLTVNMANNGKLNIYAGDKGQSSTGIYVYNLTVNNGLINVVSSGVNGRGIQIRIWQPSVFTLNRGTVITQGGEAAFYLGKDTLMNLPETYWYWTNTIPSAKGAIKKTYPQDDGAFVNSDTYKYVKIEG